jgi:DNA polymerase elongation subunit (family B)
MSKKNVLIGKSFRLIDFNIYDDKEEIEETETLDSKNNEETFIIAAYGINEKGESVCLYINDFTPYFYINVSDHWTESTVNAFLFFIRNKLGKYYSDSLINAELVEHKKLYGFSAGKTHKFLKLNFKNKKTMNKTKNYWFDYSCERKYIPLIFQNTKLELYESQIPPLLRYFHIQNISPSGWVLVTKLQETNLKKTSCTYEYICSIKQIKPLNNKETIVPYKICSFDIEASSSHGDFPLPVKTYKKLAINILDIFNKQTIRNEKLLTKIILTAFNYDNFQGVDPVYPKEKIEKKDLLILIDKCIHTPFDKIEKNEKMKNILSIVNVFEQQEDSSDNEFEEDTRKTICENNFINLLINNDISRDEKIKMIDEAITMLLPQLEGDKVTFIGSTFLNYGSKEPYLNHCYVLGTCDPIADIVIETVETEKELLLKWVNLIQKENPDIIIGYNIFGFDYEFLFRRSQELECESSFLLLSKNKNELCANYNKDTNEYTIENTKIQLSSGEYDLKYYKMIGRIQIDMYCFFRKDYNLSSYKLDDVVSLYISDDIQMLKYIYNDKYGKITEIYSNNLTGLKINDYIHIEITNFSSDIFCYIDDNNVKKTKFMVLDIIKENIILIQGHINIPNLKSVKWTMTKDDITPQDIFRLSNGSSSDRAIVAKYCVQDCNLVHHLMNKIDVLTSYIEMSRLCSVPISYLVFRGQGIKLTSYVAKKCRELNTLMPDLEKKYEDDGYEGAIVLPPKCSMYIDNPVACVDFASLYPTIEVSYNLSHDSKVWAKEYDLNGNLIETINCYTSDLNGFECIEITFDTYKWIKKLKAKATKVKVGYRTCCWETTRKGIIPYILEELLNARKITRNMIKNEKDIFMQNILDKRQLSYKITANSVYGQCGAKTSTFYEKDVAACTTSLGRSMIVLVKNIVENIYNNLLYETKILGKVKCMAEYVYGDSVAYYTPIYIRYNNVIDIITIERIAYKYGNNYWQINKEKEYCELNNIECWSDLGWTRLYRVIRHKLLLHKKMYRILTNKGLIDVTDDHSLLLMNGNEISPNDCNLDTELLHFPLRENSENLQCYSKNIFKNMLSAANYTNYLNKCNINYKIQLIENNIVVTICNEVLDNRLKDKILLEQNREEFVYDLTTKNNHFAGGVGDLIVHNTDSVFFTFNLEDPVSNEKIRGKKALEITIEIAQDVAQLCTKWLKTPMELTYEKTLMPFILLSKKKYVGILYENDPNKGKLKFMGLSLKRRDNCDYLKDTYGNILNILMTSDDEGFVDIQKAINYLDKSIEDLIKGNVSIDKLMITKSLRSDYKRPESIAHKVLADRISQRDPGNKPKSGDRMQFIYIVNNKGKLLGERIETPEFIKNNNLQIDYEFYITNQLQKPLLQLFGLALEQIWFKQGKTRTIAQYNKDMINLKNEFNDLETFNKKKEKYCSSKVSQLLFEKHLIQINNKKNNIQNINKFFISSKI